MNNQNVTQSSQLENLGLFDEYSDNQRKMLETLFDAIAEVESTPELMSRLASVGSYFVQPF